MNKLIGEVKGLVWATFFQPSVKAIRVSQTCCFPTEPTSQAGDLQPLGKHTYIHKHMFTHIKNFTLGVAKLVSTEQSWNTMA